MPNTTLESCSAKGNAKKQQHGHWTPILHSLEGKNMFYTLLWQLKKKKKLKFDVKNKSIHVLEWPTKLVTRRSMINPKYGLLTTKHITWILQFKQNAKLPTFEHQYDTPQKLRTVYTFLWQLKNLMWRIESIHIPEWPINPKPKCSSSSSKPCNKKKKKKRDKP